MNLVLSYNQIIPFETIGQMRALAQTLYHKNAMEEVYLLASLIFEVVETTNHPQFYADCPFGVCPFCGECEAVVNVDGKTYGLCHEHRICWYLGRQYGIQLAGVEIQQPWIPKIVYAYTEIAIENAFPKDVCSCCGLFLTHKMWCILYRL